MSGAAMNKGSSEAYRQALAAFRDGRLDAAGSHLREAIAGAPQDPHARHLAGVVALTQGRLDEAERQFEAAVRRFPRGPAAAPSWAGLGRARLPAGRLQAALACFRRALELAPEFAPALSGQAAVYCDLGDYRSAEACARAALALAEDPRTRLVLARTLLFQSRVDEAEELLRELAGVREVSFLARFHQAGCAAARGRRNEAEAALRALLLEQPHYPGYLELARLKRFREERDPDIATMRELLGAMPELPQHLAETLRADVAFALAKACDDLGSADAAFSYLREANGLRAGTEPFDPEAFAARAAAIAAAGRKLLRDTRPDADNGTPAPLVIAALPRSGSTLLEQMLRGHPRIAAGGEFSPFVPLLEDLAEEMTTMPAAGSAETDGVARARAAVSELLSRERAGIRYLTEKSPVAFLYSGMLCGIYPGTRIIHLKRHPLDAALSQYMQSFAPGLGWTYDLGTIARYHTVYEQVMDAWGECAAPHILEVEYEALVHDAQAQLERVLRFCGLDWDPACLQFERRSGAVMTASGLQVREPLTRRSIGRWRRYASELGMLREELAAPIARHEERLRRAGVPC